MPTDLEQLRSSIATRRNDIAALLGRLKEQAQTANVRYADAYDQAAHAYDVQLQAMQRERAQRELLLLDDALLRIRARTYGSCALCAEAISYTRLQAIPWARYCMVCQRQQEQGRRTADRSG